MHLLRSTWPVPRPCFSFKPCRKTGLEQPAYFPSTPESHVPSSKLQQLQRYCKFPPFQLDKRQTHIYSKKITGKISEKTTNSRLGKRGSGRTRPQLTIRRFKNVTGSCYFGKTHPTSLSAHIIGLGHRPKFSYQKITSLPISLRIPLSDTGQVYDFIENLRGHHG